MIRPFGEHALLVEVAGPRVAQALDAELRRRPPDGVVGTIPGLSSVLVELDPGHGPPGAVEREISRRLELVPDTGAVGRERRIPVVYGGAAGPDLAEVAGLLGQPEADVVARHASVALRVLFLGFAPGYPYLGDLPDELRVPRLATPRTSTPPGSVAIADRMTGIYPAALPGGWRVIGRTPIALFDPRRDPPAYLAPGDLVRFQPIDADAWDAHTGAPDDW